MAILVMMCLTLCLILTDIGLKSFVEGYMRRGEERSLCDGKVVIRKVYNKGMCLNLLEEKPEFVKITSAYTTVLLTIYQLLALIRKVCPVKKAGLSLMTAGAWSNTFDRWIRGYVIDYIGFQTKNEKLAKITYNLGDFCIAAGGILVMIASLFGGRKKR